MFIRSMAIKDYKNKIHNKYHLHQKLCSKLTNCLRETLSIFVCSFITSRVGLKNIIFSFFCEYSKHRQEKKSLNPLFEFITFTRATLRSKNSNITKFWHLFQTNSVSDKRIFPCGRKNTASVAENIYSGFFLCLYWDIWLTT